MKNASHVLLHEFFIYFYFLFLNYFSFFSFLKNLYV